VGILALFIEKVEVNKRNIRNLILSAMALYPLLQSNIVRSFVSIFDSRYKDHLQVEAGGTGTLLNLMFKVGLLVLLVYLAKDQFDKQFDLHLILACIILFLATGSWTIARLEPYFSILFTVTASRVLSKVSNRPYLALVYLGAAIYFGFYVSFYNGVTPYKGFFSTFL
jgi:hypothetical protein